MRCKACNGNFPINKWRTINLGGTTKTSIRNTGSLSTKRPINYYTPSTSQKYTNIYACPRCGTCKIITRADRR